MKYKKLVEQTNKVLREKYDIEYPPELEKLTPEQRQSLPSEEFALPKERKYPIYDESHAKLALEYVQNIPGQFPRKKIVYKAVLDRYPHLLNSEIVRLNKLGMEPERIYEHLKKMIPENLISSLIPEINKVTSKTTIKESDEFANLSDEDFALPHIRKFPIDTIERAKLALDSVKKYPKVQKYRKYVFNAVYQRYPELFDNVIRDFMKQDPNADDDKIYDLVSKDSKLFSDTYVMNRIRTIRSEMGLSDIPRMTSNRYPDGGISPFE